MKQFLKTQFVCYTSHNNQPKLKVKMILEQHILFVYPNCECILQLLKYQIIMKIV
jgi:hypothetical protein